MTKLIAARSAPSGQPGRAYFHHLAAMSKVAPLPDTPRHRSDLSERTFICDRGVSGRGATLHIAAR